MGQRYQIDSNVLIDYVASRLSEKGNDFAEKLFNSDFLISVVVKIEVLGFNDLPSKLVAMEEFMNMANVIPLDEEVTKRTIQLRRTNKKLKLGDAIIAATAIAHNMTLITRNTADFKNIEGLEILVMSYFEVLGKVNLYSI